MEKVDMICYTWQGARDLYHGVPDLEGAVVEKVERDENAIRTVLHLKRIDRKVFKVAICPQE